jgi:GT2 family glycosyltransferase
MYDVSLSIVTFNNEKIIERTLKSIITHINKRLNYIIYIIDNNSHDQTVERVKYISGNIIIIRNSKNIGFGSGHNLVLDKINSRYHIIVNPDIIITNNCINKMYEYMEKHLNIGMLSPLIRYPDGRIQYLCKRNPSFIDLLIRLTLPNLFKKRQDYFMMKETNYDHEFEIEYATGCFMFFRTELLKQIGGFDENFFLHMEDADITRRVNEISTTIFYPFDYVIHDWQRNSHKEIKLIWATIKSAFYYFKKWGFKLF